MTQDIQPAPLNHYKWAILSSSRSNVIIREIDLRGILVNERLCFCGSGKPYQQCHNSINDNTAMAYLFEAFRMIDDDIKSTAQTPVCKKGCVEC